MPTRSPIPSASGLGANLFPNLRNAVGNTIAGTYPMGVETLIPANGVPPGDNATEVDDSTVWDISFSSVIDARPIVGVSEFLDTKPSLGGGELIHGLADFEERFTAKYPGGSISVSSQCIAINAPPTWQDLVVLPFPISTQIILFQVFMTLQFAPIADPTAAGVFPIFSLSADFTGEIVGETQRILPQKINFYGSIPNQYI